MERPPRPQTPPEFSPGRIEGNRRTREQASPSKDEDPESATGDTPPEKQQKTNSPMDVENVDPNGPSTVEDSPEVQYTPEEWRIWEEQQRYAPYVDCPPWT